MITGLHCNGFDVVRAYPWVEEPQILSWPCPICGRDHAVPNSGSLVMGVQECVELLVVLWHDGEAVPRADIAAAARRLHAELFEAWNATRAEREARLRTAAT